MGKVLNLIGGYAYSKYAVRVADLEGTRRAAVLAVELRARKVAASDVAAELGKVAIRTPYDREPFTWDAADPSIVFVGMQPGERGEHALILTARKSSCASCSTPPNAALFIAFFAHGMCRRRGTRRPWVTS